MTEQQPQVTLSLMYLSFLTLLLLLTLPPPLVVVAVAVAVHTIPLLIHLFKEISNLYILNILRMVPKSIK